MKKVLYLIFILPFAFLSCNNDEEIVNNLADYIPLKVGNMWIYQSFRSDSLETNYVEYTVDTIVVTRDTVINGDTYYQLEGNIYGSLMYNRLVKIKDEYLIDVNDYKFVSILDNGEILNEFIYNGGINGEDTIAISTCQMTDMFGLTSLPLGNFESITSQRTIYYAIDNFTQPYYIDEIYAKDIGMVVKTMIMTSDPFTYLKSELIDYQLTQ